jgi:hypothetical protein
MGSRIPYGYTYTDKVWTIDESAANVVRRIFSEFTNPYRHETLSAIADALNTDEIPTQRGGKWHASTIRYILSNGWYAAKVQYDGQADVDGTHPAIVTVATYQTAQGRLNALKPGPVR